MAKNSSGKRMAASAWMGRSVVVSLLCASCAASAASGKAKAFDIEAETRKVVMKETGKTLAKSAVSREELAKMVAAVPSRPRPDVRGLPPTGRRSSWVENGHLVLDGKPILRRNMYAGGYCCSEAFLAQVKADDIHTTPDFTPCSIEFERLLPGTEAREGKKHQKPSQEVFDAVARRIDSMKGKDFAYYYLCDEPECRGVSPVYLKWLYEFLKERDPYHAVFICSRDAVKYIECADCIEVHPYIDPFTGTDGKRHYSTPISTFGNYIEGVVEMDRKDKVIGCTPTAFSYDFKGFQHLYPTFDEYVASVWAILVGGGKSIYPFLGAGMGRRPCIYEGVKYTFSSAEALEEMLLLGVRRRIERTEDYETAEWTLGGDRMFVAVNLGPRPLAGVKLSGVKGKFMEFRGGRTFGGWSLFGGSKEIVLDLKPFEVVVATTKKMDEGLESLAEVKAREEKLEYERTHRDNQILGKAHELQFAASKPLGVQAGIADGMLVQQAELLRGSNPWYEISFPKEAVVFRELRVHGENTEKTTVKIRRMGKWVDLKPSSSTFEGYSLTLKFAEDLRTRRIRFEFHKDKVNLHEIEIPRSPAADVGPRPAPKAADARVGNALEGQSCLVFDASNAVGTNSWSGKLWYGNDVDVHALEDGGFAVGKNGATHALRLDPKWRWMEFDIYKPASHPNERGYANWSVALLDRGGLAGSVRSCPAGLYTIPIKPVEKPKSTYVAVRSINTVVPFRYIRLCERPPKYLEVTNPNAAVAGAITEGDVLHFELVLDEPCEDVSLTFYSFNPDGTGPVAFTIDGKGGVDLECGDGKGLVWTADVKVKKSVKPRKSGAFAKAVVLGGSRPLTIRTRIPLHVGAGKNAGK